MVTQRSRTMRSHHPRKVFFAFSSPAARTGRFLRDAVTARRWARVRLFQPRGRPICRGLLRWPLAAAGPCPSNSVAKPSDGAAIQVTVMQAADAQAPAAAPEIMRLNPELLAKGGLVVAEQGDGAAGFGASVAEHFLPINMTFPGLRALNVDPPVFGISGFLAPDECDALVTAAKTSGKMAKSSTGGGPQREGAAAPVDMRTSTSVPLTQEVSEEPFSGPSSTSARSSFNASATQLRASFGALPPPLIA